MSPMLLVWHLEKYAFFCQELVEKMYTDMKYIQEVIS